MNKQTFFLLAVVLTLTACSNWTPLSSAAYDGDIAGMQKALDSGADIDYHDDLKMPALYWAVDQNRTEAVSFLLDKGAKINREYLHLAAKKNDEMSLVFANHLKVGDPYLSDLMYFALVRGHYNTFFELIEKGVKVPLPDPNYLGQEMKDIERVDNILKSTKPTLPKYDAMTLAIVGGSNSIVNYLILMPVDWRLDASRQVTNYSWGASPDQIKVQANLLCIWSRGHLFYNEKSGYLGYFTVKGKSDDDAFTMDTLSYFVNKDSINSICKNGGSTPIGFAASRYHSAKMVKQLIALGADPFVVSTFGSTLLHYSTILYNPELVKYLIDIGIDPRARNNNGQTAYDLAGVRNMTDIQNILAPYTPRQQTDNSNSDLMGKLAATAGLIAVGSQANLSSEQMSQFVTAATQDVWLNDGKSNNLAQLQQSALASSSKSASSTSSSSSSTGINKAHGPKKPLRNQGVCKDYTIDNYKDANLVGEPQIDTLCATGIVHYRVYLANYGRSDADAKELEKVYQAHVYSMETANKVDKATQMPSG